MYPSSMQIMPLPVPVVAGKSGIDTFHSIPRFPSKVAPLAGLQVIPEGTIAFVEFHIISRSLVISSVYVSTSPFGPIFM